MVRSKSNFYEAQVSLLKEELFLHWYYSTNTTKEEYANVNKYMTITLSDK